jgi:hypothetical protein
MRVSTVYSFLAIVILPTAAPLLRADQIFDFTGTSSGGCLGCPATVTAILDLANSYSYTSGPPDTNTADFVSLVVSSTNGFNFTIKLERAPRLRPVSSGSVQRFSSVMNPETAYTRSSRGL